jgi:hypothetical protein
LPEPIANFTGARASKSLSPSSSPSKSFRPNTGRGRHEPQRATEGRRGTARRHFGQDCRIHRLGSDPGDSSAIRVAKLCVSARKRIEDRCPETLWSSASSVVKNPELPCRGTSRISVEMRLARTSAQPRRRNPFYPLGYLKPLNPVQSGSAAVHLDIGYGVLDIGH